MAARAAAFFLLLTAAFLLVVAGYWYFAPPRSPSLQAETDIEVADAMPGEKRDVVLRLRNESRTPVPILSMVMC